MPGWMKHAESMFGRSWLTPLSEVTGNSLPTVRRWRAAGKCPANVDEWLSDTARRVPPHLLRAYGSCLRDAIHWSGTSAADALRIALEAVAMGRLPRADHLGEASASPSDLAKYLPRSHET